MAYPSSEPSDQENHPIVLYDGICGLCNRAVHFILNRDQHDVFRFAWLQSDFAAAVLQKHGLNQDPLDTVYLVLHRGDPAEQLLARSDAGLAVLLLLGGFWRLPALIAGVLPKSFRDFLYNRIARNRDRMFGKYKTCPLPTSEERGKFLDQ